jgi:hypothetical protein
MTTEFSAIKFDKRSHTYHLDGRRLPSVTSLVNRLKPPFDSNYWARRKAEERGVEPAAILAEWEQKRQEGFRRGTAVHEYIAGVLEGKWTPDTPCMITRQPEMTAFDAALKRFRRDMDIIPVHVEWIVGDADLGFAGTLDALMYSEISKQFHVFDWKTGDKFRSSNRFQTLLPPFTDFDECESVTYSMQVSLYRLAIERNTDLAMGNSWLVHLDSAGGHHLYDVLDLRESAEAWLRDGCR